MTAPTADAQLVTAYLAGDRNALAGLYDRFAPSLYDTAAAMLSDREEAADVVQDTFLVAAERMGQLRDPERIKPWLFAIARHEIYRRTKRRKRVTPSEAVPEMAAPTDHRAEGEGMAAAELALLVRDAAVGLDDRDRLVLELSVRQGLQGADLAAALGVTAEQSYTLVHRMRERVERSLGALLVARTGRKECAELSQVLLGWDGTFSVLWRKRVARHVDSCQICERTRRKVAPLALYGAAPAMALPPHLRERVLSKAGAVGPSRPYRWTETDGFPRVARGGRRLLMLLGATGLVAVATVVTLGVTGGGGDDALISPPAPSATTTSTPADTATTVAIVDTTAPATSVPETTATPAPTVPQVEAATSTVPPTTAAPTPPPVTAGPGKLEVSGTVVDLGRTRTSATISLTNVGGSPLGWSRTGGSPFTITGPTGTTLDPGVGLKLTIGIDRSTLKEGAYSATLTLSADTVIKVSLKVQVERDPSVTIVAIDSANSSACVTSQVFIQVSAGDESGVASVTGVWSGPGGAGSVVLTPDTPSWFGSILQAGGFGKGGTYTLTVTATDNRGNTATDTSTFSVGFC